jgi:hypothetical protein
MVAQGTYYEHDIDFQGKAITVMGTDPEDQGTVEETIIDAGAVSSVFTFNSGEDSTSVLTGLTITGGYDGAISCVNSSPTITRNIIKENSSGNGIAIYCTNSDSKITDNTLTGNTGSGEAFVIYCWDSSPTIVANAISGNDASGIYCSGGSPHITNNKITRNVSKISNYCMGIHLTGSSATITDNSISYNRADTEYGAAIGVYCEWSDPIISNNMIRGNHGGIAMGIFCDGYNWPSKISPTITHNIIMENASWDTIWGGGGIGTSESSPTINNNIIVGNSALQGGGIWCYGRSSATITNNTIAGNSAEYYGGGIAVSESSFATITNTILWDNNAPIGSEIAIIESPIPSAVTISYSDVQGGQDSVYVGWGSTLSWGAGMIDTLPLFEDCGYQLHFIPYWSRCIDAGDPAISDECQPPGLWNERSDMGAYGGASNCGWVEVPTTINLFSSQPPEVPKGDTLSFCASIWNNTGRTVAGDFWLSAILPNSNEVLLPQAYLNDPNPLSGQIPGESKINLFRKLYIPTNLSANTYYITGKIGTHPNTIMGEDLFEFKVVE